MRTVVLSLYIHTDQLSMSENQVWLFCRVDQSVSQQIDLWEHFILVLEKESCLSPDQSNFLVMSFSRRKTTKKFRRQCSAGCSMMTSTWNKALRMSLNWVSTIMYLISLLLPIGWDPVFKSLMSCQRISQLFSMRSCTSLTLIWSQRLWTFTRLLEWSMNPSHWFHLNLKLPCRLCKLLCSLQLWKSFPLQVLIFMILMSSSQVKRSRWHSSQINV